MNEVEELLDRYVKALDKNGQMYQADYSRWHRPDVREFSELLALLTEFAEQGEARCQYAVASIYMMGFCYEQEEDYQREYYEKLIGEATKWWVRAASQGHWGALDNLLVCGVGPEAERVRTLAQQFESERPGLVGYDEELDLPIYGPNFMQQLCKFIYGRVIDINTSLPL